MTNLIHKLRGKLELKDHYCRNANGGHEYDKGRVDEHARTKPIIDALLKVADHAIHTELCAVAMENGVECTCGLDDVLRELSQAVEGDPAQKGG